MRLIDADALPRYGNRGGLVNWYDIEKASTVDAWKFVYEELTKLRMFTGIYDARTSDAKHYINGVWTVMEVIAERAGCHDEFDKMFIHNVVESEERAERKEE